MKCPCVSIISLERRNHRRQRRYLFPREGEKGHKLVAIASPAATLHISVGHLCFHVCTFAALASQDHGECPQKAAEKLTGET